MRDGAGGSDRTTGAGTVWLSPAAVPSVGLKTTVVVSEKNQGGENIGWQVPGEKKDKHWGSWITVLVIPLSAKMIIIVIKTQLWSKQACVEENKAKKK